MTEKQKVVEKEAETERKRAIIGECVWVVNYSDEQSSKNSAIQMQI